MLALRRLAATMCALATVTCTTLALAPQAAQASTGPSVTIVPNDGAFDKQFVEVDWAGFPASTPVIPQGVAISQCKASPVTPKTDCAPSQLGVTGTDGTGASQLQLATGNLTARDGKTTFACGVDSPCTVAVYTDPNKPFTPVNPKFPSAIAPITFLRTGEACDPTGGTAIDGAGAEAGKRAVLRWSATLCAAANRVVLSYVRSESHPARESFIGDEPDVWGDPPSLAVTSEPLSADESARAISAKRPFRYAPIAASGLSFAYLGFDRVTGAKITNLTLTPSMLAHIFNGKRNSMPLAGTDAESAELLALNPGVSFSPTMLAFGRLDKAASTKQLTSWFLDQVPAAWKDTPPWVATRTAADGSSPMTVDYQTPTDVLPDGLAGPGATGQLLDGSDLLGLLLAGKGSIGFDPTRTVFGYLDSSTAAFYGLPTVCIQMDPNWATTGTPCVKATPESISAALAEATVNADGTVTTKSRPTNPAAYPLPTITYALALDQQGDTATARALRQTVELAVGEGQTQLPQGYAPLPESLRSVSRAAAARYTEAPPAAPPVTTTTVPSTPSVPTTAPAAPSGGGGSGSSPATTVRPIVRPSASTATRRPIGQGAAALTDAGSPDDLAAPPTSLDDTSTVAEPTTTVAPAPPAFEATAGAMPSGTLSNRTTWALLAVMSALAMVGLMTKPNDLARLVRARTTEAGS